MKRPVSSRIHKAYFRNGEDHRAGADVSFADIVKIFGFRGIEVGRWVSKEEQQIAANLFFDALCDLMDILQVPETVISLKGTLALAFGVGGQKYVCAHYNSAKRQLALAKNAGGGALAHEWFHAFDHYISSHVFMVNAPNQFASELWLNDSASTVEHPLNQKLARAFGAMFLNDAGTGPNELVKFSVMADKARGSFYYARPQELAARAFESVIEYQVTKNAFLVDGALDAEVLALDPRYQNARARISDEAKFGIYPKQDRLMQIQHYLFEHFYQLGLALKS
ncbi:CLCA_X family protein [Ningiella sp. W23]|uniref:CLCA_X family protein n=1 Tax=Ningiella sp. W23 TaxID=3023715 RepID=UPI00375752DE